MSFNHQNIPSDLVDAGVGQLDFRMAPNDDGGWTASCKQFPVEAHARTRGLAVERAEQAVMEHIRKGMVSR